MREIAAMTIEVRCEESMNSIKIKEKREIINKHEDLSFEGEGILW